MMMPKVNLEQLEANLTEEEFNITKNFLKKDGSIRSTKPKINDKESITGKSAYVWRMVVFMVSPKLQHQCMPVTASFDLPAIADNGKWCSQIAREQEAELKNVIDAVVDSIPKNEWHGVQRWAKAFGGF